METSDLPISCVYEIFCIPTKRRYIGSTKNYKKRIQFHLGDLRRGSHHNYKLQTAYNKYKEYSFVFNILEKCNPNVLLDREQYYIDINKNIYNITRSAIYSSVAAYYENVKTGEFKAEKYPAISDKKRKQILSFKRNIAVRKFKITPKYYGLLKAGII